MGKESATVKKALEAAKGATSLRLHFPDIHVTEAATNLSIAQAKPTPTLSISKAALGEAVGETPKKYILVSIDLDAPFPSFSFLSPLLHGLHIDLVAGETPNDDGFVPLERTEKWLVPYIGPGPPKPSTAHHYVFLAFEQPAGLDAAKVRELLALGPGPDLGLMARIRWDPETAFEKLGLGPVVAQSYFLTAP